MTKTIEIGRLCMKIAGRDAGRAGLIVEVIDKNFVVVDGNVRKRKCNIRHLELLPKKAELKGKTSHEDVMKALQGFGFKPITSGKYKKKLKAEKKEVKEVKAKSKLLQKLRKPKAVKKEKPKKSKSKKTK